MYCAWREACPSEKKRKRSCSVYFLHEGHAVATIGVLNEVLELIGNTRWVLVPQVSIPSFQLNEGDFLVVLKDLGSFSFSSYGNMFYPSIDWGHSCYSYVGMVMERRDCQVVLVGRINIPDWSLEVKKTWWVYRKKGCLAQVKWLKRCVVMFLSSHHEVSRIIESSDSVERRLQ